ncbi:nuclear transport factor 2 family protein [Streptomyces sp. NBC_01750]|uniref:nuclear transport factor 2 family protein n=1 Tax=Streptomyces sp. NBC_01750 TaxID=2975928 RepID=UPI002DD7F033|nr:nuclear transport factor 2 family protein [Streptomyces sp. NBC_01750]WSD37569.1 nuclear transport factor 2 family protein [Streptomyces sp. NBC_01750]
MGSKGADAQPTVADYDSLVRRLRDLEDKEALRALMIRGWRALDRKDWQTWIACWAEEAVLEFGPWEKTHGKEAVRAKVEEAESPYPSMQHHILNMHFDIEGNRATGIGYMWFVAVTAPGKASSPYSMGGPYDWEFRRGPNGWLLVRQRLGVWWTDGEDTLKAFE